MLQTKFCGNQPAGAGENVLKGFNHIGALWPSWSCNQHHVIKFSFPCTGKLSYNSWFRSTQ